MPAGERQPGLRPSDFTPRPGGVSGVSWLQRQDTCLTDLATRPLQRVIVYAVHLYAVA
jgi:hypothetical protein